MLERAAQLTGKIADRIEAALLGDVDADPDPEPRSAAAEKIPSSGAAEPEHIELPPDTRSLPAPAAEPCLQQRVHAL